MIIPIFGDQYGNANEAERRGYGISVPLYELTEERLYDAMTKVLNDPAYAERAREHGTLVTDEITKPLDRAIWWLEYAMRHPGMNHMRSPVHDLHWTQYFLLDVIGFFVVILAIVTAVAVLACKCCCRLCCAKKLKTE